MRTLDVGALMVCDVGSVVGIMNDVYNWRV